MKLEYAAYSSRGLVRDQNEDACLSCVGKDSALFLVADGIGGLDRGEVASSMIRSGLYAWWKTFYGRESGLSFREASEEIRRCVIRTNQEIFSRMGERSAGSTLVLLFLFRGSLLVLSSGDSRVYRARGLLSWKQITVDDVYENSADRGVSYDPAMEGRLTAAIGIRRVPSFTMQTEPLQTGDRFLLCSDGVYRFHSPASLRLRVSSLTGSPEQTVAEIAQEVERRGAGDNYTLIYLRVLSA